MKQSDNITPHKACEYDEKVRTVMFDSEYFPITIAEHLDLLKETGFGNVNLFWHSHIQAEFYAVK